MTNTATKLGKVLFGGDSWIAVKNIAQCIETILLENKIDLPQDFMSSFTDDWAEHIVCSAIGKDSEQISYYLVHLSDYVENLSSDQKAYVANNPNLLVLNNRVEASVVRGATLCGKPTASTVKHLVSFLTTSLASAIALVEKPLLDSKLKKAQIEKLRIETETLKRSNADKSVVKLCDRRSRLSSKFLEDQDQN